MTNQYNLPVKEADLHTILGEVVRGTTDKKLLLDIIESATDSYMQQGGSVHVLNIRLKRLSTPIEASEVKEATVETE